MRKVLLVTLCIGLPALVASCGNDSNGDQGSSGGSSGASTSSSQGGSSGKSSSSASGGSSAPASSSASGGSSSAPGSSSGGASTASSSGGKTSTGGSNTGTGTGGKTGTGGSTTATSSGGSTSTGGSGTGGGSTNTGGTGTGGRTETGGNGGGGTTSTGGSGTGGGGGSAGLKNDPVPSKGCGKTDGVKTMTTGGSSVDKGLPTSTKLKIKDREYIIDIPADYDPTKPYRLIFSWHQAYGSATGNANGQYPANQGPNFDAKNYAYFGLQRESTTAKEPAIFIAPQGIGNFPWDYNRDVVVFDDLLALATTNLCIDESRVFTTGFSFGAMMSYALSIGRATKLRAAVTMAAANYNFTQPTNNHTAIGYLGFTGMSDGTCPWGDDKQGGKACVLQHAKDNSCTTGTIPEATKGSKKYVCYDFEGCKAGYPVKVCTFDGNHTPSVVDDGSNGGDDGLKSFIPPLAWKFISQF